MDNGYFAGLFDGEGTACIVFTNALEYNFGVQAQMNFSISLNYGELALKLIKQKYGGNLCRCVDGRNSWTTRSPPVIKQLLPILLKNCIVKRPVLEKFRDEVLPIFERDEHTKEVGLRKLIELQKTLNYVSTTRKDWNAVLDEGVKRFAFKR